MSQLILHLWLHRDDAENWWVSAGGVGVPTNLPKSQVVMPDDAAPAALGPGGPFDVVVPRWLATARGLVAERDTRQGELL